MSKSTEKQAAALRLCGSKKKGDYAAILGGGLKMVLKPGER